MMSIWKVVNYGVRLYIVFFLIVIAGFTGYSLSSLRNKTPKPIDQPMSGSIEKSSSCEKIIKLIKENNTYFTACNNGVFVVTNLEITQSWSTEELGIYKITSMTKSGNKLYVGGLGVVSIDLSTGNIFSYRGREKELGLNVGIAMLVADNDTIWVATFGDLYKINTTDSKIEVLTYIVSGAKLGFDNIVVTPNSVYVLAQECLYRYDKVSGEWDKFDQSTFGPGFVLGTYSETFSSQLVYSNGVIMQLLPSKQGSKFWYAIDKSPITWKPFDKIMVRIETDYPSLPGGYLPIIKLVGYDKSTGSAIFYVNKYEDITYYYANPIAGEIGLAGPKFGGHFTEVDGISSKDRDRVFDILNK